eukprot:302439-Rhodomonas_salina.2
MRITIPLDLWVSTRYRLAAYPLGRSQYRTSLSKLVAAYPLLPPPTHNPSTSTVAATNSGWYHHAPCQCRASRSKCIVPYAMPVPDIA